MNVESQDTMKYNDNGGRFTADWSDVLQMYYMAESIASGFADYEDYYQITKDEYDHFSDADFMPAEHRHTLIYAGHRYARNTPRQEEMGHAIKREFNGRMRKKYHID